MSEIKVISILNFFISKLNFVSIKFYYYEIYYYI
jgi:hypothetical protein